MNILHARSYHQSLNKLTTNDKDRCYKAITQLHENPRHPGLNLEYIGKTATHNHHSIRASRELRIILGVEPNLHAPQNIILTYIGHHDDAYTWSEKHNWHTDMSDGSLLTDSEKQEDLTQRQQSFTDAEEWQLFLHPDQKQFVHKKFFGEARILGAAGTGKTVLALHRAAYLGKHYSGDKILFTTYSRSLPQYLHDCYSGIPDAPPNVEFINIDRLANRIISGDSRDKSRIDLQKENLCFDEAWKETLSGTSLEKLPRQYLKEEIERVIKGRDAKEDEYLDTGRFQRIGRKRGFNRDSREICWNLKEAWDARLQQADCTTFVDKLIAARDKAYQNNGEYRAIIVDEYQDITLVAAQFLRALVAGAQHNPVPDDGLLFFGDAAQRIYAGGWKPSSANLKFRKQGSSITLQTNYRNTRQIVDAAIAVRGDAKTGEEQDEQLKKCDYFELGDGELPVFFKVEKKMEIKTIAKEIKKLIKEKSLRYEQIGILMYHNKDAEDISKAFKNDFSIPCFLLADLRKKPLGNGVRIGTFDRGKGLEFQAVFLPKIGNSIFPDSLVAADLKQENIPAQNLPAESLSAEEQEHRQLQLDRLYVGMTRAVRFLYLLADEEPCAEIINAEHFFEWR